MKILKTLTLGVILLSLIMPAQAAKMDYEEEMNLLFGEIPDVVTATLTEQNAIRVPSTVTVVTDKEIKRAGIRSLMELLDRVAGIRLSKDEFGRQTVTLRGVKSSFNDKFKLMIDGHSITEPVWGDFSEFYNISLENVKQVEIVRGPGSSLYGTNALAGVINVIMKKPSDVDGAVVDFKVDDDSGFRGNLLYGKSGEDFELGLNFNHFDSDGPEDTIERDRGYGTPITLAPGEYAEGETSTRFQGDLRKGNFNLRLSYSDVETELGVPQLGYLTQDGEKRIYEQGYVEASYLWEMSDRLSLKTKASYDMTDFSDKLQPFPNYFSLGRDINGDGVIESYPNGGESEFGYKSDDLRLELLFNFQVSESNQFHLGFFFEKLETKDIFFKANAHPIFFYNYGYVRDLSSTLNWNEEADREVTGFFFQDEWTISDAWHLVLGGRFDDYSDFGSTFNPKTALVWEFSKENGGALKLMYGTSFKAPTFSQLYNQNNPSIVGNKDLDAENLSSVELAMDYIFGGNFHTQASVFFMETEDVIDVSGERDVTRLGAPRFFSNSGEAEMQGIEFQAKYVYKEGNYIYGSYTFTDAEDKLTGETIALIPESQGTLGFNFQLAEKVNLNLHADYTGEIEREAGDSREDLDATWIVDTTLYLEDLFLGLDVYGSVYNLLDEDTRFPATVAVPLSDFPRQGISYVVGAKKKF